MTLLIKGMEMPESGYKTVYIHSNGYVYEPTNDNQIWNTIGKAASVPTPHGRLIDADALNHEYYKSPSFLNLCYAINAAPTVIEVEGEIKDETDFTF